MSNIDSITEKKVAPKAYDIGGNGTKFSNWRGLMFSIRFKTDKFVAFPYAYIQKVDFDDSHELLIEMPTEKILIEGNYLTELYYALIDHQVRVIVESDAKYQAAPKGEPFIYSITSIKAEPEPDNEA